MLISVIIPTLNEQANIGGCLHSIKVQNVPVDIIVVDGGSVDKTVEIIKSSPNVTLLYSKPGRGGQIACGVKYAKGEIIVVLHADSVLKPHSFRRIIEQFSKDPLIVGGAFGLIYQTRNNWLRFAVFLHNFKTRFTGIAFGDQAQFYRKNALADGFPKTRLMEDVELSIRLRKCGKLIFLPNGVISSNRQWVKNGHFLYFFKVLFLTMTYLFLRYFGLHSDSNAEWFYKVYYGRKK